jgi:hypothetical protein
MTRTLFLHLGMNKAGSTTIQKSLAGAGNDRVRYATLDRPNHTPAIIHLFGEHAQQMHYFAGRKHPRPSLSLGDLEHELGHDRRDVVISGEGFPNILQPATIADMLSSLAPHFDRIRGLAYIRPPRGYMRSLAQQRIKVGVIPLDGDALWPDYRERFEKWEEALGAGNLTLIPFERERLDGQDVLTDFARRVGFDPASVSAQADLNRSMSAEAFATLFEWRHRQDERGDPKEHGEKRAFPAMIGRFGSTPFDLGEQVVGQALRDNSADIAWVEARMGQKFAPEVPPQGAVVFESAQDVLDFSAAARADFAQWARGLPPRSRGFAQMKHILDGLAPPPGTLP